MSAKETIMAAVSELPEKSTGPTAHDPAAVTARRALTIWHAPVGNRLFKRAKLYRFSETLDRQLVRSIDLKLDRGREAARSVL